MLRRIIDSVLDAGHSLGRNTKGNVAIIFSLALMPLSVAAGAAVDYISLVKTDTRLQHIADISAIAGTTLFITDRNLSGQELEKAVLVKTQEFVTTNNELNLEIVSNVTIDEKKRHVSVILTHSQKLSFGWVFGIDSMNTSGVATAEAVIKEDPICILALNPTSVPGILFQGSGDIDARNCVVWSNSQHMARSMAFSGSGKAEAAKFCAVGNVGRQGRYEIKPDPESGCAPVPDPMKDWVPPVVGSCTSTDGKLKTSEPNVILEPGVYCNGLRITADSITMNPGIYIIKDGPLILRGNSKIKAKEVGIYLTGTTATMDIAGGVRMEIEASKIGPMAGVAIAQNPTTSPGETSRITGNVDLKVGGAIYFPTQKLSYWGNSQTQAQSPVTTIIADSVEVGGDAYLEVANKHDKAKYAPMITSGQSTVRLVK